MAASRFPSYLTLVGSLGRLRAEQPSPAAPSTPTVTAAELGVVSRQELFRQLEVVGTLGPGAPLSFVVVKVAGLGPFGHPSGTEAGNAILRAVAGRTRQLTRATDLVGHLTGSTLGIVLQRTGVVAAGAAAARLSHHLNLLPELSGHAGVVISVATGTGANADTLPFAAIDSFSDCG